jgi:hypothetical protein
LVIRFFMCIFKKKLSQGPREHSIMGSIWTSIIKKNPYIKLHIWANLWKNLEKTHTFKKTCNNELMCGNLTNSNAKKCLKVIRPSSSKL